MNKIFKVIWSKSKQCYIVVSEMAKNHSGKKKIVVASILAAMAVGTTVFVEAAKVNLGGGTAETEGSIAIGTGSFAKGTSFPKGGNTQIDPSIAIGTGATAEGNSSLAIGLSATVDKKSYAVAIGRYTKATDDYGIGIGYNVRADLHGVAVGEQARALKEGATTLGVSSRGYGKGAIAIGWQSLAGADVYTAGVPGNDINNDSSSKINDYNKWGDMSVGLRALATGGNATALGRNAAATATNAVAIGGGNGNNYDDNTERTQATAEKAVAIGYKALASDKNATSIGTDAQASKVRSTAIGYEVRATGNNAVAIGSSDTNARKVVAAGESAIAVGTKAQANNDSSTAIGKEALAGNTNAIALGTSAEGKGASSTAIGNSAQATKTNAIALGTGADASEEQAVAIGKGATAEQTNAVALGTSATSGGANGVAIGNDAQAQANDTIAVGSTSRAENVNDSAFGNAAKASGGGSTAIGYIVKTTGNQAFGAGSNSEVSGTAAIGIGYKVTASGNRSISIGNDNGVIQTQASGEKAIAIGSGVQSTGSASTAIGKGAIASQDNAFAAGTEAKAQATDTVAIGSGVTASGLQSISIGSTFNNITNQATGKASIAIGAAAQSKGDGSVALGRNVKVLREYTTAVGMNITASDNASASTILGYNSYTKANQSVNIGSTVYTEAGGQYSTAIGYTLSVSGKNAIGIGSSDDGIADDKKLMATGESSIAIGTRAQGKATGATAIGKEAIATASSAMALGTNANAALAHSVALGEGSTTTEADGAGKIAYLTNESTNNSGNGVISVGNKRNASDTGTITRRIVSVAGGTDDYDAVNVKQLKALEANERHIKVKTGNAAYTPDANGKITLNYVNGKGEDVPNEVTEIKDVAKKSDEWTLRTQDGNTTAVATPQTVNGLTKKAVTLKAGDNIAISNTNGVVTLNVTNVVKSVATDNTNALDISNTNGTVKINPKLASSVNAAGEANKLVTAGTVKTALDDKIDKTAEMHIKSGEYTVNTDGTASLTQQNGNNQDQSTRVTIKDIAKKSVVDTLQSDYNTFKTKAITFTGDDNQGVARRLDTTLTVKGGANYTSTIPNTNIRVEKDGTTGLAVKLSDKLTGIKEISGTGSQDLVINNGNTKVTVKAPSNGDNGTVDFGNAKVVAPNLDASISYKAGNGDTKKTVKLQDGFNFTAATDTTTTAEGPKSGLAIKAEDNGKVTFGLDKATRNTIDNAADKNLSNLTDTGKDKVKELAKTAAQDAVKVAAGTNTTVATDTTTTSGVTTYKVNANDTTVAVTGNGLAITGGDLGTDKVRKYSLDLSAATKGKLAAVGNIATNVIGGTTIATDGTVTGPTFSITKADGTAENAGTIKEAIEKLDSANKGQNTKISGNTEKLTKLGETVTTNYNDLSKKISDGTTNITNTLTTKGLNFTGNDTTDAGKVHRDLGTTLTIKGAENFTREANAKNNIDVVKNTAGDGFDVKLAANLANMKEISGNGKDDLVIKNGDATITLKPKKDAEGTNPATPATVDFGETKVVASNLDANIAYKAGSEDTKKKVKLQDGFNFTAATDTTTTAEGPKSGLAIKAEDNGKVTFGLDKATRSTIDNAVDKNLSNLSNDGENKVKELAKGAAQDAVKVADGINTTVTTDTTTTGVTTYKVNANDTTVAVTGDGLAIKGGDLGTDKVRKYSLDLSDATKGKLKAVDGLSTVIGGTNITTDGTVTGPTFNITKADGTTEEATTIKDAIDKLNATNAGQNTKISETAGKVTTLEGKVNGIVDNGMVFAGDEATADKVTRKLGETLNIHGQNNITVKKDGTAVDTLNVKLASDLKNITSISSGDGTTGSKVTLDANGVSIANTAAGAGGAAGETKTVTIGKDGINTGGMKITNVAKAEADGDAANKKYVDEAISNLDTTIRGNATLNFAGNVTKDAQDNATEKVGLSLATGTLHVNGANNEITTTAKGDTITVGLAETVKAQLAKIGDTSSNGRDGANGLTGKDGLNDKTLTDKVNALRNGEAGSVVYTNDAGDRVVKAKDGKYYKADEVKADGTVKTAEENNGKAPKVVENPQARVVNGNGETTVPTTLSNIADGKVAAGSKDAVNGGQLNTVKTELATALGGGAKVENGVFTGPTYNITKDDGTGTEATSNVGEAISKLDGRINNANTTLANKGLDFTGNDTTAKVHRNLGETLTIKGAENFTREAAENNIKVVKNNNDLDVKLAANLANIKSISNATGAGKPGSTITLDADGVSIANTAAGQDGAVGETKTVTIGKDGINAGGMKITNVTKAEADGDAANKKYVDDAISNLNTTVTNNANLRYAGDTNEGATNGEDHLNLPLATATLKVAGTADQIKTVANNGTITLSLDEKVTNKLAKLGDTASNGRDGANGLTGKDGLNDKTLTEKVNALRNGEAGSVVYTDENGVRLVKAKDGEYYKAADVDKDGNVLNGATKATTVEARLVNPKGETTVPTKLSNIADGKVAAGSKDAVNGGQLYTAKSEIGAIIGGTTINENGKITGPTFSITNAAGTKDDATTIKDAIEKLDATNEAQNTKINDTAEKVTTLDGKVDGIVEKGMVFAGDDATADKVTRKLGETLNIHGQNNITVKKDGTAVDTLNVKLASDLKNITSISSGDGTTGSKVTLDADGVSIANTAAGQGGAAGETKTVTIGKDGINAGGMKITNVGEAKDNGDAANKKYVDDAITNLNTTVTNNANLRYAGDTNVGAAADADHLNLPLATGTLKVAGTADQIKTVANNGTITLSLDEKVTNKLDKLGDTASNGRDGKDGASGAKGLTGADGLNDKTLTDKVNALRNGEAGSVVYTNDAGDRVVKAKDGKYYKADEVKADGTVKTPEENNGKAPKVVENPQARVVNGNGETTVPTTLSNIADGKVAANSKDAVNGGQLHTVKSDLATALGGDSKVNADGSFTGPTYNITKDDGTGTEPVNNVGAAISKLDGRINNANTVLGNKGLDFYGNKDAADTDKVHRNLGEALKVKGAENFTREANAKNNIDVVKNTAGDGFDVKLAENLANIKEISGNGKDNLVIKNGDATITLKPKKDAEGTNPATPATVDFGDTKVVASNLDASIKYRANDEEVGKAKSVKLADGFNFVASKDATTTAEGPKSGLAITTGDNGVVTFGLDKATRSTIDNATDKNLSNLSDAGKDKVKELAKGAAQDAVKVADGINTTVEKDTATAGVTTYKVNANDTTVAVNADSLAIAGGDLDATTKVRAYTLDLSDTVKAKLNAINNVGDTASNGRDGKDGTSSAQGLTGKDGLNDKTLTDKVNALRNGEAGSVVYTNDAGDRVVKAKDGKYYKADEVKADGTVKTAEENNGKAPKVVENPQARVVNGNGETTAPTTLSNIADGKVAANSKDAVNGGQLHTVKSDLATALGGDSKVNADGSFTGPTYNITKDDGTGTEEVKNVGDAISKLDGRINNANTALGNKGLDFYGNKDAADTDKVHRNLGEALKVKGAENFTREANAKNNIDVVKNTAGDGFDVKLAENLGNIKEIAGNGKDNLVIKNGDATITLKPKKEAEGTNPATPATVDFGNTKVVASNLDASITYRANSAEDADAKTVKLQKGLNFVSGDGTTATAETAKAGITIAADKDGKVVFGLNEATRNAIDNAADKNLSNLSDDGKNKVKELAKTAAQESVKVASGNNVTVTPETKDGVTTYTVNGRDTTVKAAENGSVSVSGGTLNDKGEREYTVDLTDAAKAEIAKVAGIDKRLGEAEKAIADNKTAINTNKDNIKANKDAIKANKDAIDANKKAVDEDIKALKGNTATKDLDNVSDKGKEVITGLIDVKGENGVTVTPSADATSKVKTFTVKIGDSATFGKGDKAVAIDGTKGTITVGDKDKTNTAITPEGVTVTTKNADGTDKSKVEIKDGTISGLTNTDWDSTKVATAEDAKKDPTSATAKERGKAATQGQIKDVVEKIVNGRGFEGDDNKKVSVALGDTLGIKGGATGPLTDNNIGVVSTEAKDGKPATMTVKLAKDVKMKDGSTSYDYYLPEIKTNPDGSKEIVKNADGSVKYKLGKDGNPIRLVTTTVNGEGVTIAPVKGLDKPTVSLTADGLDNGGNQIHNVAAGTLNTDAATVGQVRAAAHALNNRVNEAGAHAAALAAMNPLSYDPLKKSQVMAGVGSYKGNKALALGVAHYANEDTLFNVGVAVGDGSNMVNAGVTYRFGGEDSAVPERYKGGPISSVYVMQDEVSALKAENAEMKAQMKMLMERIEMLAAK
ncbi:YadA-like family protein [Veillonella sp. VA141]|uniref:YadA-like family protein n=1 Tax=Veillonella sp. VA141 TaxID=741833 RepID=UPI000F8DB3C8|nr:YadA-like family protein [Veillonella sp. VA141]